MTITEAITAFESAATALDTADGTQTQAQSRFETAQTAKGAADKADADAVTAINLSLDDLIAAATLAKVSRPPAPAPVLASLLRPAA